MKTWPTISVRAMLVTIGLTIGLLSITAHVPADSEEASSDLSILLLSLPKDSCDAWGSDDEADCPTTGRTEHVYLIVGAEEGWLIDGDSHPCEALGCDHGGEHFHTECETSKEEEDLDALFLAIETLRGPELQRLMERNPERLLWNAERRSVQLWGCGGQLAASIILSDDQVESLTDS